jgi:predicted metal-dependent hydrolase
MTGASDEFFDFTGKRYLLKVVECDEAPSVELKHSRILLRVRPGTDDEKKQAVVEEWYREKLKKAAPPLIAKWEPVMGVKVERFFVQRMKTKWGSCTPGTRSIRLNTDLAKKPPECLEYIVVHELAHLVERYHNDRFRSLMDNCLPHWKLLRQELNNAPLAHADWAY